MSAPCMRVCLGNIEKASKTISHCLRDFFLYSFQIQTYINLLEIDSIKNCRLTMTYVYVYEYEILCLMLFNQYVLVQRLHY